MSQQSSWVKTTCPYCGTGCGVEARVASSGKVEVRGDEAHPANSGLLCSKGSALGETVVPEGRLRQAYIKGHPEKLDKALSYVASRLSQTIAEHGPDSVAFYVSGQLLTEDYYVANKLIKGFIGTSNIDSNSRLCMSSAVAGHKRAFGEDLVPGGYEDLEQAELVTLVGSNLAWCHPIVFQRLKKAKAANPNLKVVVVDPRRTDSCDIADLHLAIDPGADVALFNGLLAYLEQQGKIDQDYVQQHTNGFAQALESAQQQNLAERAAACGVNEPALLQFFAWFAETEKCVSLFSQGVNQSVQGVDKVNSIINCHLATGKLGKPGATAFSITGQPNAMGGREVGALSNLLAGHLDYLPEHLGLLEEFWQAPNLSQKPGAKAVEMFDKIHSGEIKAVWIMGTNPAVSLPNSNKVQEALLACPLVVVSDCIADTDTSRYADVLLPAAGWGEREGTVTNSERVLSRQRPFVEMQGDTQQDWWLLSKVANYMGFGEAFGFASSAEIFAEHAALTALKPSQNTPQFSLAELAGLDEQAYRAQQPQRWPLKQQEHYLFADGKFSTADGKAKFIAVSAVDAATPTSEDYPLVFNTGRVRDQWHTMTRTALAPQLNSHCVEPQLEINPVDAKDYQDGEIIEVSSEFGALKARVKLTQDQKPGQVFMPIHWNYQQASSAVVSELVAPKVDPLSGQPESKRSPVAIAAWVYTAEAVLLSATPLSEQQLAELELDYWVKQGLKEGYLYRIASVLSPAELAAKLSLKFKAWFGSQSLDFQDPSQQRYRCALVSEGELHASFVVVEKGLSEQGLWLEALLKQPMSDQVRRGVLSGTSPEPDLGKIICSCHQVREKTITDVIEEQGCTSHEEVGKHCKAGTNCGSCVPELKRLIIQTKV